MFWIHPDGAAGEAPDGAALPDGAVQVNRGQYQKHLREQAAAEQAAADSAAQQQQVVVQQQQLAQVAVASSAHARLRDLGFSEAEAALLVGGAA